MKRIFLPMLLMLATTASAQEKQEIEAFNLAGPYAVGVPFAADTVNVQGKKFEESALLDGIKHDAVATTTCTSGLLPSLKDQKRWGLRPAKCHYSSRRNCRQVLRSCLYWRDIPLDKETGQWQRRHRRCHHLPSMTSTHLWHRWSGW